MKGKIFNTQEVQAILNGSKVMFREVIKPQPFQSNSTYQSLSVIRDCPYQVGQKIFCKETYEEWDDGLVYKADNSPTNLVSKWKPAQHMKQEHSRLTLLIKEIRVERLGEVSEGDAIAEGVFKSKDYWHSTLHPIKGTYQCWTSAKQAFSKLWNATHKKPEEKFEASPFVWVISFEVVK